MHWKVMGLSYKPNIYVSWSISELRVRFAPWNRFKPSSEIFLLTVSRRYFFVDHGFSVLCLLRLCARLFICALCSPAGKGLTSRFWCLWVCHFPIGILAQVWYLIVSISDLCNLTYFAVVQLLNLSTQVAFKIGYWSTLRYEMKQCFQKQITTRTKDVFSLLLCEVFIYILVIYNCKNIWYCFIFYEIMMLPFWLKSSLMQYSLAFNWHSRFYVKDYIKKMFTKKRL